MSRIPRPVVAEVQQRAGDQCEACGFTISGRRDLHHRKARGMGGTTDEDLDVPANLLQLHGRCHHWAHEHPVIARKHGWIVRRDEDFAQVGVKVNPSLYRWAA